MRVLLALTLAGTAAFADPPAITAVSPMQASAGWHFSVTLAHPDTGWTHYADGWRIETIDGVVLGTRELMHPHVDEQPFTRALAGVEVPADVSTVFLRAKCNVDGWQSDRVAVSLD